MIFKTASLEDKAFFILLGVFFCWSMWCATTGAWTTGDAWVSVGNAKYIVGDGFFYNIKRGPLLTLMYLPAEITRNLLNLPPLNTTPYNILTTLIHSFYLFFFWLILINQYPGEPRARLIILLATGLTVTFASYANQMSPDILPGLLLLVMVINFFKWQQVHMKRYLFYISLSGVLATLIKPTYAILWILFSIYVFIAYLSRKINCMSDFFFEINRSDLIKIIFSAFLSGVICWFIYTLHASGDPNIAQYPFWLKVPVFIESILSQVPDEYKGELFAWYLYIINLHNYGISTLLIVLFSIIFFVRDKGFMSHCESQEGKGESPLRKKQAVFITWIILAGFLFMQTISYKEVRYLLFLMPSLGLLLVSTAARILKNHYTLLKVLIVALMVDLFRVAGVAKTEMMVAGNSIWADFFSPINRDYIKNESRIISSTYFSNVAFSNSPFLSDRYHGIEHLTGLILSSLLDPSYSLIERKSSYDFYSAMKPNDVILYSSSSITRIPKTFFEDTLSFKAFAQFSGTAKQIEIKRENTDHYALYSDQWLYAFFPAKDEPKLPIRVLLTTKNVPVDTLNEWGYSTTDDTITLNAVRIYSVCLGKMSCHKYEPVPKFQLDESFRISAGVLD